MELPANIVLTSGKPKASVLWEAQKVAATVSLPAFVDVAIAVVVESIDEEEESKLPVK